MYVSIDQTVATCLLPWQLHPIPQADSAAVLAFCEILLVPYTETRFLNITDGTKPPSTVSYPIIS